MTGGNGMVGGSRAAVMREVRVVGYEKFMQFSIRVWVDGEDGKVESGRLQTMRYVSGEKELWPIVPCLPQDLLFFMLMSLLPRQSAVRWSTVPEEIRELFQLVEPADKKPHLIVPH